MGRFANFLSPPCGFQPEEFKSENDPALVVRRRNRSEILSPPPSQPAEIPAMQMSDADRVMQKYAESQGTEWKPDKSADTVERLHLQQDEKDPDLKHRFACRRVLAVKKYLSNTSLINVDIFLPLFKGLATVASQQCELFSQASFMKGFIARASGQTPPDFSVDFVTCESPRMVSVDSDVRLVASTFGTPYCLLIHV